MVAACAITTTTLGGGLFDPAGGIELADPGPTPEQLDETDAGPSISTTPAVGSQRTGGDL